MKLRGLALAVLMVLGLPTAGAGAPPPAQEVSETAPIYTLDTGDKVRVTVYGEQSVNGEYSVGPAGDIAFPLIGDIPAKGKTVSELQQAITAKLASGYILDPRVSIDVLSYRPYYILGEVSRPGQYPYVTGLSVEQAVASAGGYTYRASKSKIYLRPAGKPEIMVKLGKSKTVWIRPGDTVRIGERYF